MGGFAEYDRYDAVGLAELVRKREVSAAELLAEARARCDRVNPELNAVVYRLDAEAERAASAVDKDRPFAGVPFLVEESRTVARGRAAHMRQQAFRKLRA